MEDRRGRKARRSLRERLRRAMRVCRFEQLEERLPLSANASPFAPASYSVDPTSGLPLLTSFPNAPAMIYLDYIGDQGSSAFDLDGHPTTFNTAEQQRIYEHWRGLSTVYSMFNVGVTTVQPNVSSVPTEWISITNDMLTKGGVNGVGVFPNTASTGVAGSDWFAEGYAHELSHGFGNWHQASYDLLGNKTDEYAPFPMDDPLRAGIMGEGAGTIIKWQNGRSSLDAVTVQKDADTIAASIAAAVGGDGYRPDDQTATSSTGATALTTVDSTTQAVVGIIERLNDQDWYSFTSTGGTYNIMVGRDNPSPVDIKLTVYGSDGTTVLATDDGDPLASATPGSPTYRTLVNDSHLTMNLPAGTYYLKVEGHGNYDDLGQYIARVDKMADGWQSEDIGLVESPGFTDYDPSTGIFTVGGSGQGLGGTPGSGGDQAQYAYTKLVGDGEIIARVSSIENVTNDIRAGLMVRDSLAGDSQFFNVYATPNSRVIQQRRSAKGSNSASTTAPSPAPSGAVWLKIKRSGNTFTSYYSTNGTTWASVSSASITMASEVYIGLVSTSANGLDRLTSNFLSTAKFTNVQVLKEGDVGTPNPSLIESTVYNGATNSYTLTGSGRGWGSIAGQQDGSYITYHTLSGDGSITVHVSSINSVSAMAGVMIRESTAQNSKYFATWIRQNLGITNSFRGADGNSVDSTTTPIVNWLRIERVGDIFRAYASPDGATWTQLGADQALSMNTNVMIGLMVASATTTSTNTATFDHLAYTGLLDGTQRINTLVAPTNVVTSGATSTGATISWTNSTPGYVGDYNHDNVVDTADYVMWRQTDGSDAGLAQWRANYGGTQTWVTGFTVERSADGVNYAAIGTAAAGVTTFTDMTGTGAQEYYYRVRANDSIGISVPSTAATVTTRPAAVTGLVVDSISTSQFVVQWNDTNGETDYTLQRSSDGNTWTTIGASTIDKNTVIYVDTNGTGNTIAAGTKYYYRVTTVDSSGNSDTSAVVSAYTRLTSTPTNIVFNSPSSSSVAFSWDAISGITKYAVYRGAGGDSNEWQLLNGNVTTTSFTDSSPPDSGGDYYRIIGFDANGAPTQTAETFAWPGIVTNVPSPWVSKDIGGVGVTGTTTYSNGTFKISGGGADVWGRSDEFHYTYTPMSGNGSITVHVAATKDPAPSDYSRAGIMIRESTATNSRYVSLMLHPGFGGVRLQWRSSTNGNTSEFDGPVVNAPYWLRLTRTTNTFLGEISTDGVTWTTVSSINVTMGASVQIGMAVTARNDPYIYWGTFDNVSTTVTGPVGGAGSGAGSELVGSGASLNGSSLTLSGAPVAASPIMGQSSAKDDALLELVRDQSALAARHDQFANAMGLSSQETSDNCAADDDAFASFAGGASGLRNTLAAFAKGKWGGRHI